MRPLFVACLAFLYGAVGASPAAALTCLHTDGVFGQLQVFPDDALERETLALVRRSGDSIEVIRWTPRSRSAVSCSGPAATLGNTDEVVFNSRRVTETGLSLAGGPLEPGGSDEPDGTNETEVRFIARRGTIAFNLLLGSRRADRWHLGRRGGEWGISMSRLRRHEFDVLFEGSGFRFLIGLLGRGNDVIRAAGTSALAPLQPQITAFAGGPGNDRLVTGPSGDILVGGSGRDRLGGGRGGDILLGGRSRDRLFGGAGRDRLIASDGKRDIVNCGPGRDAAKVDRKDAVRNCERIVGARRRATAAGVSTGTRPDGSRTQSFEDLLALSERLELSYRG